MDGECVRLAFIPEHLKSAELVERWVALAANEMEPGAAHIRPIDRWWVCLAYMMKAGEEDVFSRFRWERGGPIGLVYQSKNIYHFSRE